MFRDLLLFGCALHQIIEMVVFLTCKGFERTVTTGVCFMPKRNISRPWIPFIQPRCHRSIIHSFLYPFFLFSLHITQIELFTLLTTTRFLKLAMVTQMLFRYTLFQLHQTEFWFIGRFSFKYLLLCIIETHFRYCVSFLHFMNLLLFYLNFVCLPSQWLYLFSFEIHPYLLLSPFYTSVEHFFISLMKLFNLCVIGEWLDKGAPHPIRNIHLNRLLIVFSTKMLRKINFFRCYFYIHLFSLIKSFKNLNRSFFCIRLLLALVPFVAAHPARHFSAISFEVDFGQLVHLTLLCLVYFCFFYFLLPAIDS